MLSFILAISIALQTPTPGDLRLTNGTRVEEYLAQAQLAVDRIGHCTEERPDDSRLDRTFGSAFGRLHRVTEDAEGIYPDFDPVSRAVLRMPDVSQIRCDAVSVRADFAEATRALNAAEALIRADTAPRSRGLWLGTLRLCGARVEAVEAARPEPQGGPPRLIIRASTAFAPRVRALTATFVTRLLPIVLDGRVVVRPRVNEPISGTLSIDLPDGLTVARIRRAAAVAC